MKICSLLFSFLFVFSCVMQAQYTLSGTVYESRDKETLAGATISYSNGTKGVTTNSYGFFSISTNNPNITLLVSFIGFVSKEITVDIRKNSSVHIVLDEEVYALEDVVVVADSYDPRIEVQKVSMGILNLSPREITSIPTIGGEADPIKVAQLLPGITSGGEGTTGMYVRGGTDDQNLVILDDAVVYNVGHLFGFFSVFNTDAISSLDILKGGFDARYGGRLSSIVDVKMKEGSTEAFNAVGGVGLLTSRLNLDGPIVKGRSSFMVAGRRTYIDKVFGAFGISLPYHFYDLNLKINHRLSDNDRIYLSSYIGRDVLAFGETIEADSTSGEDFSGDLNFGFDLGNFTTTLRWNHIYAGQRLFSNFTAHQTQFSYDINGQFIDNNVLIRSRIQDFGIKADWDFFANSAHSLRWGAATTLHLFRPNVVNTSGDIASVLEEQEGDKITTFEWALYASDSWKFNDKIGLEYGLRYSGSVFENTGYNGLEPRLSAKFQPNDIFAIKAGYSVMRQYMHRVSSSSVALPTDLWYPVTDNILPQKSEMISAGFSLGLPNLQSLISVEAFYKTMENLIEYREGARLLLNDNFEDELLSGTGRAYGIEILLRKRSGAWNGWLSYSLSNSDRQFDELNDGNRFQARFDRRHVVNVINNFRFSPRLEFSAVWVLMSGGWFTAQTGQYLMPNASLTDIEIIPIYSGRNEVALSPTHRFDISFIIKRQRKKRFNGEWQLGAYNFYNRAAPFQIVIQNNGTAFEYAQNGLFGFIPFFSYNFDFRL